jgi:lipopolysaccharide export LptBFGC system permease protein LptF
MSLSRYHWRRVMTTFATAFVVLTSFLLLSQVMKQTLPAGMIVKVSVLSLPFIVCLTLPMAILIAVLRVFTGRAGEPEVTSRRMVASVVAVAACVGCLALLWNDRVLPWSNHRLRMLLVQIQHPEITVYDDSLKGDREMTIGELRTVVRTANDNANRAAAAGNQRQEHSARQRAATYEVEIQKKYAIAAACVVFALFGAAMGLRIPGGGWILTIAVSIVVFMMQYVALIGGEELGDRLVVSPFFAMWTVNLVLGIAGVGILWSVKPAGAGVRSGHGDPQAV